MKRRLLLSALTALGILTSACADHTAPPNASTAITVYSASAIQSTLRGLTVAPDGSLNGYSRDQFGNGWKTQADGCSTRVDVLEDQGSGVVVMHCHVTAGTWTSLYDGQVEHAASALQIDHLVPLAEAWRTGAARWSAAQRKAFANDIAHELVAVSVHSNESKGDSPPPDYEPPSRAAWCTYASRWVSVKSFYRLTVTATEVTALTTMLDTCSG